MFTFLITLLIGVFIGWIIPTPQWATNSLSWVKKRLTGGA